MPRSRSSKKQLWVVKVGSALIADGGLLLIREWMRQVAALRENHGISVVWVSSGAIVTGAEILGRARGRRSVAEKQALSAVGQSRLIDQYCVALQAQHLHGAQILLTWSDLARAESRKNFVGTVKTLLQWNVVPVLNENDAVATEEIRFGDNDQLSARVALALRADRLVMLTHVDGLYDGADVVREIAQLTPRETRRFLAASAHHAPAFRAEGTGGIASKLDAARQAQRGGIASRIARGDQPEILLQIARGARVGTEIVARRSLR